MRIGLVNDLPLAMEALRRSVVKVPGAKVAWCAVDGAEAVRMCANDRPDMVLMDLIMPVMDGVEATRRIMRESPCPILVVTATVTGNAACVFEALGAGALDAIDTPNLSSPDGVDRLCRRIQLIARLAQPVASSGAHMLPPLTAIRAQQVPTPALIGASTGGPLALRNVLLEWPRPLPFSAVIVQHLDAAFVPGLAEWLARETRLPVRVALPGSLPEPGTVWLAGGEQHLILDRQARFRERPAQPSDLHHPSVDALFLSAAESGLAPGIAALLTGMGSDGAQGMRALRDVGWKTVAQDQTTSVVWGMPGAAVQLGAAARVVPIQHVGPAIHAHFAETGSQTP
jgi:two-component system response regulator WspF